MSITLPEQLPHTHEGTCFDSKYWVATNLRMEVGTGDVGIKVRGRMFSRDRGVLGSLASAAWQALAAAPGHVGAPLVQAGNALSTHCLQVPVTVLPPQPHDHGLQLPDLPDWWRPQLMGGQIPDKVAGGPGLQERFAWLALGIGDVALKVVSGVLSA